jgi:hypothetical protein
VASGRQYYRGIRGSAALFTAALPREAFGEGVGDDVLLGKAVARRGGREVGARKGAA